MYYMGGKLAHWFGITSPDWQYAIDVYEEMKREVSQPWAHRGGVEAGVTPSTPPLWAHGYSHERRPELTYVSPNIEF